jgi:hypothetical protein
MWKLRNISTEISSFIITNVNKDRTAYRSFLGDSLGMFWMDTGSSFKYGAGIADYMMPNKYVVNWK